MQNAGLKAHRVSLGRRQLRQQERNGAAGYRRRWRSCRPGNLVALLADLHRHSLRRTLDTS
jgi:hypothetical protein